MLYATFCNVFSIVLFKTTTKVLSNHPLDMHFNTTDFRGFIVHVVNYIIIMEIQFEMLVQLLCSYIYIHVVHS